MKSFQPLKTIPCMLALQKNLSSGKGGGAVKLIVIGLLLLAIAGGVGFAMTKK
jgi:hypothetical protein